MRIEYKKKFSKRYDQAPPKIQQAFNKRVVLFAREPFNSLLNNHSLKGKYRGLRSINITGDWRAIFREAKNYQLVIFETMGRHGKLYKK